MGVVERDLHEVRATLSRLEPIIIRIDAQIPHLATKADLAGKPSHAYLWGVLAVLVAAYGCGLAALAVIR